MERFIILIIALVYCVVHSNGESETILSSVLTPDKNVIRQQRSYYERYGYGRPYDRLDDRPSRCGRCDDDDDDDDDYDRGRDRDDDKRSNRPTYGSRHDKNKNYNDNDDRHYDDDRSKNKNGTDDDSDDKRRPHDDKDRDRHSSRKNKPRNRYDDRDRYRPDYYDRFLRDPYRDRYDDPYSRRPYDRYPDRYPDRYNDYGRYDEYAYSGYRRPYYNNRYDRGNIYDDSYGGYGPGVGRGPHDRPWDETYRGQAGWDTSGRGYYFASGRPDASAWGQREYSRPATSGSWQNSGYSGYSGYTGSVYSNPGYASTGYGGYQDNSGYGYGYGQGQSSGWRNVGERRPYRDQSGVANLDTKPAKDNRYGQNQGYSQIITYQPGTYTQSSTTPSTSYLFQREDEIVTQETTLKV